MRTIRREKGRNIGREKNDLIVINIKNIVVLKKTLWADPLFFPVFCARPTATLHPFLFHTGCFLFLLLAGWAGWLAGTFSGPVYASMINLNTVVIALDTRLAGWLVGWLLAGWLAGCLL